MLEVCNCSMPCLCLYVEVKHKEQPVTHSTLWDTTREQRFVALSLVIAELTPGIVFPVKLNIPTLSQCSRVMSVTLLKKFNLIPGSSDRRPGQGDNTETTTGADGQPSIRHTSKLTLFRYFDANAKKLTLLL